ncbi:HdeD family acid-resistance protein [Hoeflea prorocentri]|uniref:HdeD family acid-resistance protein n=1 Tax=Hoeflea prorocentri TaxID=1922333 RepID=A0A9X3UHH8_9HYPH|nr:HdeD family acid-resistance protein [Hoeflea prorocentri]MCY6380726.1 HdeD family acid-resistance protein [Hoeflea prorocentri]MDA5398526.1 HdeD family acid-resistance protein [Hoeflea prorocentri]
MSDQFDKKDIEEAIEKLKAAWGWLVAIGIISLIGGFLSFANPMQATLAVDYIAGFMFILVGVAQVIQAFSTRGAGDFMWTLGVGILTLLVGAVLVGNPVAGAASLTIIVAVLLIVLGGAKIAYSISMRPAAGWGWVTVSGIVSVFLGVLIFAEFPWAATSVLGLFLGVELTFNGVALLMTGLALRKS